MSDEAAIYCMRCGGPGRPGTRFCRHCGFTLVPSSAERGAGIAFLLNETLGIPMRNILDDVQREALVDAYEPELFRLTGWRVQPEAAAAPAAFVPPRPPAVAPFPAPVVAQPRPVAPPRPPRPPAPPREPYDWSWLAEQQANLFLFAGAFLVVIAALIYVGYSGEELPDTLKMSLLVAYTAAFIAAGVFCLRFPRVEVAGRVFFAVGAILVPLNFVAAYNIFQDENFDPERMWLAGSLASALFYTCVGATGLGRPYSFAAGGAFFSATFAALVVTDAPSEWYALPFVAVALTMLVAGTVVPEPFRSRVCSMWTPQAQAAAPLALAFAVLVAFLLSTVPEAELTTRWFLAPTMALGLAFYAVEASVRRQRYAHLGAAVALGGLASSVVFGAALRTEYHAYALVASGAVILALARWAAPRLPDRLRAPHLQIDAVRLAQASVAAGVLVAIIAVLADGNPDDDFALGTRWFLTATFAGAFAVYAMYITMRMPVLGEGDTSAVWGVALSLAGMTAGVVYATELSPEFYAFAALAVAPVMLALSRFGLPRALGNGPATLREDALLLAHIASVVAAGCGIVAVYAAARPDATYQPATRWFLPALFGGLTAFYLLALASKFRPAPFAAVAAAGAVLATFGVTNGIVYALDVSAEYYAFASLMPAIALGAALHLRTARIDQHLSVGWREPAAWAGRALAAVGVMFALFAAIEAESTGTTYVPDSGVFLPLAFLAAATFFALDASSTRRWETSATFVATLVGAGVTVVYAAGASVEWYGVAFSAAGLALGFGGRVWSPAWLDARARDVTAAFAVTAGWLPFEGVYRDVPRIAAATHLAAAVFYAAAAFGDRTTATFNKLLDVRGLPEVRIAVGWLYAAGLAATLGYINVLRSFPAAEDAEAGSLAVPLMLASITFLATGAGLRVVRPDFRAHTYAVALLVAVASIASADGADTLAVVLSMAVVAWVVIAIVEDAPLLAAPAAVFGFAAVAAFREDAGGPLYVIPMAYTGIAIALYAAGFALRPMLPRWSDALRNAGALYALVAPAAGFGILAQNTEAGLIDGQPFEQSALYQWSTLATALAGVLAVVESSMARRGWAVVAGSAVLLVALLLQIGTVQPDNIQAYTAVIGAYLVALGLVGLSRLKLIPELTDTAQYVEALGATIVMLPSFLQSFDDGWAYTVILVVEAAAFFTLSVALRRRGLLATSLVALVLVAGRVLFDAVNALPNWIVVLIAGMALLGVGMGILMGRDRWEHWQTRVLSWWEEMGDTQPAG